MQLKKNKTLLNSLSVWFYMSKGNKKGTLLKVPNFIKSGVGGIRTLVQTSNT